jgi:hypothetical protein
MASLRKNEILELRTSSERLSMRMETTTKMIMLKMFKALTQWILMGLPWPFVKQKCPRRVRNCHSLLQQMRQCLLKPVAGPVKT